MEIEIIKRYFDKKEKRIIAAGETISTDKERGIMLIRKGFAKKAKAKKEQ